MKVPDELVDAGVEAARTGAASLIFEPDGTATVGEAQRVATEAALEAVLPKVRERLLSDEAIHTAVSLDGGEFIPEEQQDEEAASLRISLAAAFDHAFPEEGS